MSKPPQLTPDARKQAKVYAEDFEKRLKAVASELTTGEKVLVPHIEHSYHAIRAAGICRQPWYLRKEFFTLIGGSLTVGSAAFGSIAYRLAASADGGVVHGWQFWITVILIPAVLIIAGVVLGILGFLRPL